MLQQQPKVFAGENVFNFVHL